MVDSLPELLTLVVALIAVVAEFRHWKRIGNVKRLAFGPSSRPAAWVSARFVATNRWSVGGVLGVFVVDPRGPGRSPRRGFDCCVGL